MPTHTHHQSSTGLTFKIYYTDLKACRYILLQKLKYTLFSILCTLPALSLAPLSLFITLAHSLTLLLKHLLFQLLLLLLLYLFSLSLISIFTFYLFSPLFALCRWCLTLFSDSFHTSFSSSFYIFKPSLSPLFQFFVPCSLLPPLLALTLHSGPCSSPGLEWRWEAPWSSLDWTAGSPPLSAAASPARMAHSLNAQPTILREPRYIVLSYESYKAECGLRMICSSVLCIPWVSSVVRTFFWECLQSPGCFCSVLQVWPFWNELLLERFLVGEVACC